MKRLLSIVGSGYVIYGILIIYSVSLKITRSLNEIEDLGPSSVSFSNYMPLITSGIFGLITGVLSFLLAFFLIKRKKRGACMVLAGLFCIGFPIGTGLGIVTLIVLNVKSVKEQFVS